MTRLMIILICFVWTKQVSLAQPGSYTFCLGFILYDNDSIISDTSKFHFYLGNNKHRLKTLSTETEWPCSDKENNEKNSISFRLRCCQDYYTIYIINPRSDTMKLSLMIWARMDQYYFIKKIPFQKGNYVLSGSMFAFPARLPENFDLIKEKRDSSGNMLVEDFWNWENKILQRRVLYDSNNQELKSEQWWENGNKSSEFDRMKKTSFGWYRNGQLEYSSTDSTRISMDRDGNIIKRVKYNSITKQWDEY